MSLNSSDLPVHERSLLNNPVFVFVPLKKNSFVAVDVFDSMFALAFGVKVVMGSSLVKVWVRLRFG